MTSSARQRLRIAARLHYWRHHDCALARRRAQGARYAARSDALIAEDRRRLHPDGIRRCPRCAQQLPLSAFGIDRAAASGLTSHCRHCRTPAAQPNPKGPTP